MLVQKCFNIDNDPCRRPLRNVLKRTAMIPIPVIQKPKWAEAIVRTLFPLDIDGCLGVNF